MWIRAPNNVDPSAIVWNLRGSTQLWTKQLAQQASNVAKLSTVQNVALAKKNPAEWRQETVKRQTETKGRNVSAKVTMYWALNAQFPLPQDRGSCITITIQTLSKFINVQSRHLMHLFSPREIGLDSSFDANSWSQRQREHEEQLTTLKLKDVPQGIY